MLAYTLACGVDLICFDLCHNNIQLHILLLHQRISVVLFFFEYMNVISTIC